MPFEMRLERRGRGVDGPLGSGPRTRHGRGNRGGSVYGILTLVMEEIFQDVYRLYIDINSIDRDGM